MLDETDLGNGIYANGFSMFTLPLLPHLETCFQGAQWESVDQETRQADRTRTAHARPSYIPKSTKKISPQMKSLNPFMLQKRIQRKLMATLQTSSATTELEKTITPSTAFYAWGNAKFEPAGLRR
ncbi:MAG: hypothetical protein PHT15_03685 [Gallionellaceae bacterium]|nr:hypothetical protein [Gallionellaceae bacterium]